MSPVLVLKQAAEGHCRQQPQSQWAGLQREEGRGRTTVPWAGELAVGTQDALNERGAVVRALGADSLDLAAGIEQQHLGLEPLNLDLLLIAGLQVERRDALELVFLGHGQGCGRERAQSCCSCCGAWDESEVVCKLGESLHQCDGVEGGGGGRSDEETPVSEEGNQKHCASQRPHCTPPWNRAKTAWFDGDRELQRVFTVADRMFNRNRGRPDWLCFPVFCGLMALKRCRHGGAGGVGVAGAALAAVGQGRRGGTVCILLGGDREQTDAT